MNPSQRKRFKIIWIRSVYGGQSCIGQCHYPLEERAELGVCPNPEGVNANQEEAVAARAAKLASTNIIDWKVEQKEDPVPLPSGEAPPGSPGNI